MKIQLKLREYQHMMQCWNQPKYGKNNPQKRSTSRLTLAVLELRIDINILLSKANLLPNGCSVSNIDSSLIGPIPVQCIFPKCLRISEKIWDNKWGKQDVTVLPTKQNKCWKQANKRRKCCCAKQQYSIQRSEPLICTSVQDCSLAHLHITYVKIFHTPSTLFLQSVLHLHWNVQMHNRNSIHLMCQHHKNDLIQYYSSIYPMYWN